VCVVLKARKAKDSENGSKVEDFNALCDILAKLSATLQGNTFP